MSTPVRVAGFLAALTAVFGLAMGAGRAVGPVAEPPEEHDAEHASDEAAAAADHGAGEQDAPDVPGGLMVSRDGHTLRLTDDQLAPGDDVELSFTVTGPDGRPVTAYDVEHEKRLHLIAVRRDFRGFQHVHPVMAADGTWTTRLDLTPGPWRVFADFRPSGGDALTLGTDLAVPGTYAPAPPTGEQRVTQVDGYTVTLDGDLAAGRDARLLLTVEKDGEPVTDLQPYLGAYGHLVALREGDLAYLHVHPDGEPGDGRTRPGPDVVFFAAVPSEGSYRLFLDFRHGGVVRTASFVLGTGQTAQGGASKQDDRGNQQTEGGTDDHAPGSGDGHAH